METGTKQRQAAKAFVRDWTGKGFSSDASESEIVTRLFKMCQELTEI